MTLCAVIALAIVCVTILLILLMVTSHLEIMARIEKGIKPTDPRHIPAPPSHQNHHDLVGK